MATPIPQRWRQMFVVMAVVVAFSLLPNALKAQDKPAAGKATVVVSALNVRKGPDTTYAKVGLVRSGDELMVRGKFGACAWLYVETPTGIFGWVAGSARYLELESACVDIPDIDPKTAEIVVPTPTVAATATIASTPADTVPAAASTPVPTTAPAPESPVAPVEPTLSPTAQVMFYGTVVPDGKGCIAWGNYVGPDILVTATHQDPKEIIETTLPNNEVTVVCYNAGRWTITMSAISNRFRDMNFEVPISAGDTFDWPFILGN